MSSEDYSGETIVLLCQPAGIASTYEKVWLYLISLFALTD